MPAKMISPVNAKKKWNGKATTPVRLCRSSTLRWACFFGRKVNSSRKILRWITTPLTSAASIIRAARPMIQ